MAENPSAAPKKKSAFEERIYSLGLNLRTRLRLPKFARIARVIKGGDNNVPYLLVSQPIGPHRLEDAEERFFHVDPVGHVYPADLKPRLEEHGRVSLEDGASNSTVLYVVCEDKGKAVKAKKKKQQQ
ncbi:MAG: hypothetical protein K2W82_17455 [Candidatus Obscuribacterales bacterium]|nr:hypothetical protein [Candidatus Obscuribacterales bacterium]